MTDQQIEYCFKIWYKPLCLYAMHYLGNIDDVEDVVQDVYIYLWKKISEGENILLSKSLLYTCVKNKCLDILKSSSYKNVPEDVSLMGDDLPEDDDLQDLSIDQARMWSAIESLPTKTRRAFLMSKRDGMKYSEIAQKLGVSENTVRNQIAKALKTIRLKIKKTVLVLFSL